jgi:hypothetical protein
LTNQLLHLSAGIGDVNHSRLHKGCKKDESMEIFLFIFKNPHGLDPIRFRFQFGVNVDDSNAIRYSCHQLAFDLNNGMDVSGNYDINTSNPINITQSFQNGRKTDAKVRFDEVYHFTAQRNEGRTMVQSH